MNKVILMGRLTRDPEVRYSSGMEPLAIARYSLAVNRKFKRDGEPDADFVDCVAFGKNGEFAEKFLKKGQMIAVVGRLQIRNWEDQNGQKRRSTEVIVEEHNFAESKAAFESYRSSRPQSDAPKAQSAPSMPAAPSVPPADTGAAEGFYPIDESIEDDDLPF